MKFNFVSFQLLAVLNLIVSAWSFNIRVANGRDFPEIRRLLKQNQNPWLSQPKTQEEQPLSSGVSPFEDAFEGAFPMESDLEDAFWSQQLKLAVEQSGRSDTGCFFVAASADEKIVGTICCEVISNDDLVVDGYDDKAQEYSDDIANFINSLESSETKRVNEKFSSSIISDLIESEMKQEGAEKETRATTGDDRDEPDLLEPQCNAKRSDGGCFQGQRYISHLAVDGRYRRSGLGTALLRAALGPSSFIEPASDGCCLFVNANNAAALAFYQANGFVLARDCGELPECDRPEEYSDVLWLRESTAAEPDEVLLVNDSPVFTPLVPERKI